MANPRETICPACGGDGWVVIDTERRATIRYDEEQGDYYGNNCEPCDECSGSGKLEQEGDCDTPPHSA